MKISSSLYNERDYYDEWDVTFYGFNHGFKITFNCEMLDTEVIIRNPYACKKKEWEELYEAIDKGQNYKLKLPEVGYIEYLEDKIHFNLGSQKKYYQFKYAPSNHDWGSKYNLSISLFQCKEEFLKALKSLLDNPEIVKYWE